ncbi:MAG TPA: family 1 glycosylhydrolase, partial [Lacipirellulaceae bacterium]|nr:family 1 glycosylhydrolase [Lacipirellulaceae bacterium]
MEISRRSVVAGAAIGLGMPAANALPAGKQRTFPPDFLWGTAISAYQSEGNNINSDAWLRENVRPTLFKERSGDACDSYHRYGEDISIAAGLGFNCYRLGIEWARIEPDRGFYSNAELDHYAKVLETCRAHGLKPIVTFNHFTTPIWFAARGGFEMADSSDLFAAFCEKAARHLGDLMHMATTFNEANIQSLVQIMPGYAQSVAAAKAMTDAAAKASGSPKFSSLAFADPDVATPLLLSAHRKAYEAIKRACPNLPVGLSLTTQDVQAVGPNSAADAYRKRLYGEWPDVARTHADFVGVQTYTRFLVDANGIASPPAGAELTDAGYEFYPQALGNTIRWAHSTIGKPIYVTENGIATNDDTRRIAFIEQALASLWDCMAEGIPVHGYMHWSLLDNFEWTA